MIDWRTIRTPFSEQLTWDQKTGQPAYHEAGHAVLAVMVCGFTLETVSISLRSGYVKLREDFSSIRGAPDEANTRRRLAIHQLGGLYAQMRWDETLGAWGCTEPGENGMPPDLSSVRENAARVAALTGQDVEVILDDLHGRAQIGVQEHWACIEAIARELLDRFSNDELLPARLSGDEATRFILAAVQ